ncbi:MAG: L-threonine 3-dehydrogenase [Gammaproteobacteria bacterium]
MKAIIKLRAEPGIWLGEVPKPIPGPSDALIKIHKTSICGTDIHIYNWDEWAQKHILVPLVIGHEFLGEVVELGSNAKGFKIGDRVSGEGHIVCGYCFNCRTAESYLCPNMISVGVSRQGCFAEYLCIPALNVVKVPDYIPDEIATILDPLGNATHTALAFDLLGKNVLITGAGPIGTMTAAIAKHAGAHTIIVTDVNDQRLALAKQMGATEVVNIEKTSLNEIREKYSIKEGFHVAFEVSGHSPALQMMIENVCFGASIAILGFLPAETKIDWHAVTMKGLTIKGIYGREIFRTWHQMFSMLDSGLNIQPVITHKLPIRDFEEAFKMMNRGVAGKIILEW